MNEKKYPTFYVHPEGDDSNIGTDPEQPFQTFEPMYEALLQLEKPDGQNLQTILHLGGPPEGVLWIPPGVAVTVFGGAPDIRVKRPYNCYEKAEQGEPRFTLIGRDPAAAVTIQFWHAVRSQLFGAQDQDQLDEAINLRNAMDLWAAENKGKKALCTDAFHIAKTLAPKVFGE